MYCLVVHAVSILGLAAFPLLRSEAQRTAALGELGTKARVSKIDLPAPTYSSASTYIVSLVIFAIQWSCFG